MQVEGGSEFSGQLSVQYRKGMLNVIIMKIITMTENVKYIYMDLHTCAQGFY